MTDTPDNKAPKGAKRAPKVEEGFDSAAYVKGSEEREVVLDVKTGATATFTIENN
jgi:hypothetical protein